eukprot:10178513-Karenia_brevis.AAC.1
MHDCVHLFDKWYLQEFLTPFSAEQPLDVINQRVVMFIQCAYETELPFWQAKHVVLALQHFHPALRKKLSRPWDALKAWGASIPSTHRVPVTSELVKVLFGFSLDAAFGDRRKCGMWLCFAVLIRVGFYALLRPGEITQLRRRDVCVCRDPRNKE